MNPIIEEFVCNAAYKINKCHSQYNESVKNILVIRTDVLGDMVITVPFFRELRRAYPDSHITLVCNQSIYNLVEIVPYVDKILTIQQIREGDTCLNGAFSGHINLPKSIYAIKYMI